MMDVFLQQKVMDGVKEGSFVFDASPWSGRIETLPQAPAF